MESEAAAGDQVSDTIEDALHKQAWEYFQLHSGQRLTTFNFYLGLSTATTAAIFLTFQKDYKMPSVAIILSLLLVVFSFVFWKVDSRNRELIRLSEDALKYFEEKAALADENGKPHRAKLFSREERITEDKKAALASYHLKFWKWHYSYATSFNVVMWLFGLTGLSTLTLSLYLSLLA